MADTTVVSAGLKLLGTLGSTVAAFFLGKYSERQSRRGIRKRLYREIGSNYAVLLALWDQYAKTHGTVHVLVPIQRDYFDWVRAQKQNDLEDLPDAPGIKAAYASFGQLTGTVALDRLQAVVTSLDLNLEDGTLSERELMRQGPQTVRARIQFLRSEREKLQKVEKFRAKLTR